MRWVILSHCPKPAMHSRFMFANPHTIDSYAKRIKYILLTSLYQQQKIFTSPRKHKLYDLTGTGMSIHNMFSGRNMNKIFIRRFSLFLIETYMYNLEWITWVYQKMPFCSAWPNSNVTTKLGSKKTK